MSANTKTALLLVLIVLGFGLVAKNDEQPFILRFAADLKDCTPPKQHVTTQVTLVVRRLEGEYRVIGCERYQRAPIRTDRIVRADR